MMRFNYGCIALMCTLTTACSDNPDAPFAANSEPVISAIADRSTVANRSSQPIFFSVSDEQVDQLAYSLTSDDQGLLPNDNIVLGGSGRNRSVTIAPVPDRVGKALLTIIVTDPQGLSSSSAFFVTVVAEQVSMTEFARAAFAEPADDDPALVNAVIFAQDADEDEFDDLLEK